MLMSIILKQSTAITVRIGPFVDVGDGFTPETGITLSGADEAELLKANGAATVDISAATWTAVTGADGWYDLSLTTAHTDTVGELLVVVQDDSVCLPVYQRFQVVEEAVYDDLFAASADPFTTLQSDAAAIESELILVHSETTVIQAKTSDTHSRLVVVEASIDSDQTSRTAAISDVKSELVVISAAVATVDAAIDSDQTSRTAAISDVKSRLVVVESSIDSDQTSRTTVLSNIYSNVTRVLSDTTRIFSDTALLDNAQTEPTGVPAANESPLDKLAYLFMVMRNRKTVTSTKKTIFGDDDVGEWEHDVSDDGTTYDESEANVI